MKVSIDSTASLFRVLGVTQSEFAKRRGLTHSAISKKVSGSIHWHMEDVDCIMSMCQERDFEATRDEIISLMKKQGNFSENDARCR